MQKEKQYGKQELKNYIKENFFYQIRKNLENCNIEKNIETKNFKKLKKFAKKLDFKGKFFGFLINLEHKIKLYVDSKQKISNLLKQIRDIKSKKIVFWGASVIIQKFF